MQHDQMFRKRNTPLVIFLIALISYASIGMVLESDNQYHSKDLSIIL